MKRIISIIIAIAILTTCSFYVPQTECFAAAKAKYVKVKQVTYEKMKKTIASQKKIIKQKNAIITEKDAIINKKKQTNSWLWNQLEEFGYTYNRETYKWEKETTPIEQINMEDGSDVIMLLEEKTNLNINSVQIIESWRTWYCYYVEADGNLYVITVKNKEIDICEQIN